MVVDALSSHAQGAFGVGHLAVGTPGLAVPYEQLLPPSALHETGTVAEETREETRDRAVGGGSTRDRRSHDPVLAPRRSRSRARSASAQGRYEQRVDRRSVTAGGVVCRRELRVQICRQAVSDPTP
jgi:hypothetical protein